MLQQYLAILRRWIWLFVLTTILTTTAAYLLTSNQPTIYQATARVIVGPGIDSAKPTLNDLRTAAQLMQTYAELATTRPVLEKVVDELALNTNADSLKKQLNIKTDETTLILSIRVSGEEPVGTAEIANAVAKLLVRLSPGGATGGETDFKTQLNDQLNKVKQDIARSESIIKQLEEKLGASTDVNERRFISDQLTQERSQLTESRRTLTTLSDTAQTGYTNRVQIVELAISADSVDPGLRLIMMMAALAGLVVGLLTALGFEYFDDTVKSPEELGRLSNIPLLGAIAKHKPLRGQGRDRLVVQAMPDSKAAENYRMLGSKLLLSRYHVKFGASMAGLVSTGAQAAGHGEQQVRSILLSGTQSHDDTSEIAANLAVLLAQTGYRVILVDAYLHKPAIGELFGIADPIGLSGILTTQAPAIKLSSVNWAPNLLILPGGPTPPNPYELLVSARMEELINELERQADIVIMAASPLLVYADSLVLASRVDGVVAVAHSGQARRDTIKEIVDSLRAMGAPVIGAIFDHNGNSLATTKRQQKVTPTGNETVQTTKTIPAALPSAKV